MAFCRNPAPKYLLQGVTVGEKPRLHDLHHQVRLIVARTVGDVSNRHERRRCSQDRTSLRHRPSLSTSRSSLRLPGRAKKIHEKVCRSVDHVPIREVWRAGTMTGAVRWDLGPRRDPRDVRIEHLGTRKRHADRGAGPPEAPQRGPGEGTRGRAARRTPAGRPLRQGTAAREPDAPRGGAAGAQYGKQGNRRAADPGRTRSMRRRPRRRARNCGGAVAPDRVAEQYQEDVPDVRPLVRRFDVEAGHCAQCRRRVQGRHPLQTSDALGAAGGAAGAERRRPGPPSCTPGGACRWRRPSACWRPGSGCT